MSRKSNLRVAFIGGGKMGEAILGGWISSDEGAAKAIEAENVVVAEPGEERRAYLSDRYGVACVEDARSIEAADIVVLAVKPQVMFGMLKTIEDRVFGDDVLFVSIAAGIETSRLQDALPAGSRLVRVMPNVALLVGAGVTGVCPSLTSTPEDLETVRSLFASLGLAFVVDEGKIDVVSAISGSGPAYVAALVEHLRDAGSALGLDGELSESIARQTVLGTAELMEKTGQTAETTRISVCSPGGSTLAALAAMDEAGIAGVYAAGVNAAVARSKELGAC